MVADRFGMSLGMTWLIHRVMTSVGNNIANSGPVGADNIWREWVSEHTAMKVPLP
jgi:hypothetical protein